MTLMCDSGLVGTLRPSPNSGARRKQASPRLIILHYTGMVSAADAINWLSNPESEVSCHYVIDEAGHITQMVAESMRAWHAGASHWAGENDINSHSIGIEIQNPGHERGYPEFPSAQMQAVAELCRDIVGRHDLRPEAVLGHSDIAPGRKIDPGEKFDWAWLAEQGVGHWVAPAPLQAGNEGLGLGSEGPAVSEAQRLLRLYGYNVEAHGCLDEKTQKVLRSFQLHFRPACADGRLDASTRDTLERLVAALPVRVTS